MSGASPIRSDRSPGPTSSSAAPTSTVTPLTLVPTDGFRPVDEDRASPGSPTPTGVANQIVSRSTAGLGLYPGNDVIQQWVTARRNGQTLASMAAEYVITAARVSSATRLHGPFAHPGRAYLPGSSA